jgi:hypothetical protein
VGQIDEGAQARSHVAASWIVGNIRDTRASTRLEPMLTQRCRDHVARNRFRADAPKAKPKWPPYFYGV